MPEILCKQCTIVKNEKEFYPSKYNKSGFRSYCIKCENSNNRKAFKKVKENSSKYQEKLKKRKIWEKVLRIEVLTVLSGGKPKCFCCLETKLEFLAIDHVNGDGQKDRKNGLRSSKLLTHIKKAGYPKSYRVLCHNCNMSIGLYGYCPHERNENEDSNDSAQK